MGHNPVLQMWARLQCSTCDPTLCDPTLCDPTLCDPTLYDATLQPHARGVRNGNGVGILLRRLLAVPCRYVPILAGSAVGKASSQGPFTARGNFQVWKKEKRAN